MKVYALTGKSGTGKSYQAMNLCQEKNIQGIIDDGLFIYHNRVEGGISAKRQNTKAGAVKTALFIKDEHRDDVVSAIRRIQPESLMILGTSDRMAEKIADRLELGPIEEIIHIEDITTEEERETARRSREVQGKHVVPVPAPQLKRAFAGYFLSPMRIFKDNLLAAGEERTVVRPSFSYMGEFIISDRVVMDIAQLVAQDAPGVAGVEKVYVNAKPDSLMMDVAISVYMGDIWGTAADFQKALAKEVETMTAFNVVEVSVTVRHVVPRAQGGPKE